MQTRCPAPGKKTQYAIAFLEDPGFSFTVEASVIRGDNDMILLNDLLRSLITRRLRSLIVEMFVLPNWRAFELPLITYNPHFVPELLELNAALKLSSVEPASTETSTSSVSAPNAVDARTRNRSSTVASKLSKHPASLNTLTVNTGMKSPDLEGPNVIPTPVVHRRRSSPTIFMAPNSTTGSLFSDVLEEKCFSVNTVIHPDNLNQYEELLAQQFLRLALEKGKTSSHSLLTNERNEHDAWCSSQWEAVKVRRGIIFQKKQVLVKQANETAEIFRGMFSLSKCSADRAIQILCNPEHNRHVEDTYIENYVYEKFDDNRCLRFMNYRIGKKEIGFLVLEIRRTIPTPQGDAFLVVYRSVNPPATNSEASHTPVEEETKSAPPIPTGRPKSPRAPATAGISRESAVAEISRHNSEMDNMYLADPNKTAVDYQKHIKSSDSSSITTSTMTRTVNIRPLPQSLKAENLGTLFLLGYYVEPVASKNNSCSVTIISQYGSPQLQKLDVTWSRCQRMKSFVEELIDWTDIVSLKDRRAGREFKYKNALASFVNSTAPSFSQSGAAPSSSAKMGDESSSSADEQAGRRLTSSSNSGERWRLFISENIARAGRYMTSRSATIPRIEGECGADEKRLTNLAHYEVNDEVKRSPTPANFETENDNLESSDTIGSSVFVPKTVSRIKKDGRPRSISDSAMNNCKESKLNLSHTK